VSVVAASLVARTPRKSRIFCGRRETEPVGVREKTDCNPKAERFDLMAGALVEGSFFLVGSSMENRKDVWLRKESAYALVFVKGAKGAKQPQNGREPERSNWASEDLTCEQAARRCCNKLWQRLYSALLDCTGLCWDCAGRVDSPLCWMFRSCRGAVFCRARTTGRAQVRIMPGR
jgi:hypothetical protein